MSVARSLNAHCNQCSYSKKSRSLAICMHAIRFSRWDRFLDLLLYAGRRVYRPLPFLSPNVAVFSMTWLLPAGWGRIIILALRSLGMPGLNRMLEPCSYWFSWSEFAVSHKEQPACLHTYRAPAPAPSMLDTLRISCECKEGVVSRQHMNMVQ